MAGSGRDSGAVVVGWFLRIALVLALIGTLAFDTISISLARAHVDQVSSDAADAALGAFVLKHSPQAALSAAMAQAATEGATVGPADLVITRAGNVTTLQLTVHLLPGTVLLGHLPGTGQMPQTSSVSVRTVKQ